MACTIGVLFIEAAIVILICHFKYYYTGKLAMAEVMNKCTL